MTTRQKNNKNNSKTFEEKLLEQPTRDTFAIRTKTDKDAVILAGVEIDIGGKVVGKIIEGKPAHVVSKNIVLALRKYNETHEDKVQYEVL